MGPDGALTSDEVNFLIYRYLLEAGFTHSAFVFGCESTVSKVNIDGKDVPIGALVSFIQKGFQFMELEANLTEDGTDVYGKYTTLSARDILTKDLKELREAARELKLRDAVAEPSPTDEAAMAGAAGTAPTTSAAEKEPIELPSSSFRELEGHNGEVLSMSWCSKSNLLATGAVDGTVKISNPSTSNAASISCTCDKSDIVIVGVEWSPDGTNLAAITANGDLILWDSKGALKHSISNPFGACTLALQWSKFGTYIATGNTDGTIIVWDPISGSQKQVSTLPGGAPVYDLHWRDDKEFAVGGEDGCVAIYQLGRADPVRFNKEHGVKMEDDENGAATYPGASSAETVNMLRWDPSGKYLASAGNDMTIGIWKSGDDSSNFHEILSGHKREVGWVSWATPSTTSNGDAVGNSTPALLASGSNDGSIRLWNVASPSGGKACIGVLDRHEEGITCVTWSPSGGHIAAGDKAGNITIWNVARKQTVCTLRGSGAVADVQWIESDSRKSSGGSLQLVIAFAGSSAAVTADLPDGIK